MNVNHTVEYSASIFGRIINYFSPWKIRLVLNGPDKPKQHILKLKHVPQMGTEILYFGEVWRVDYIAHIPSIKVISIAAEFIPENEY